MTARRGLRFAALGYLALLLIVPVGLVAYRTFEPGVGEVWDSITTPAAVSAFWLTLEIAAISVVLNTVLGILTALLADLPFQVIFALPGMVLATVFVSLPFVAREVIPVLREVGDEQEQAAATLGASWWQSFWRITLPAIRWGVAYGVILSTARAIGEFGAVSVVSGKVAGETVTMTLLVENRFQNFDLAGAYAASALLALIALATLLAMTLLSPRRDDE
jgi:sulfate transport system permease protein